MDIILNILNLFFEYLGIRNIKVVLLDDIKNHPKNVVKDVYRFLGVSTDYMPNVFGQKINTGSITKFETVRKNLRRTLIFLEKIGLQSLIERLKHNNTLYKMYLTFNMTKNGDKHILKACTRKTLNMRYLEDLKKLEDLINRDLRHWYEN